MTRGPPRPCGSATALLWQLRNFCEPARQETPLGVAVRELERAPVGVAGLVAPVETAEQVGAGGVEEVVALERELVHQLQSTLRPARHRDGDRAIQLHDGRRRVTEELRVERRD